jgi:hypothetical protein
MVLSFAYFCKPNDLALSSIIRSQWRPVAYKPDVPKRIDEAALPMDSPWRLVILNIVKTPGCACV